MLAPDNFIEQNGEEVTIYKITALQYDTDYSEVDWAASTKTSTTAKMLVGNRDSQQPSLKKMDAGWDQQDILIVFFPSNTDIGPRDGIDADVVENSDGERWRVVRTDFDSILGITKKKVFLEPLRGGVQG